MHQHSTLPFFGRQWLEGLARVAKYASMIAGFILLVMYGFVGAVYVLFQVAVFVVGAASFAAVAVGVFAGIPSVVSHWQRRDENAGFATGVIILMICWGVALGLMAGQWLGKLSGEFMVIDLPGV